MADDNKNDNVEPEEVEAEEVNDGDLEDADEADANDQRAEYVHPGGRDYRVEGNDVRDYVGVDPEYMTYASETEAPILTDTERFLHTSQYDHLEGNVEQTDEEREQYERDRAASVSHSGHSVDALEPDESTPMPSDQMGHTEETDAQKAAAAEEDENKATGFPPFQG